MTLRHPAPPPLATDQLNAEAIFKEARSRQRRRRITWALVTLLLAAAVPVLFSFQRTTSPSTPLPTLVRTATTPVLERGALVVPEHPYAMAVAPNGSLYVIDVGRDQILRLVGNDKFRVVAGTGQRGFLGDGAQAVNAKINVTPQSGITVASNGTMYFTDTSNGRVREVLPDGVIKSVIGGGTSTLGRRSESASDVALKTYGVNGLIVGPDGDFYVAAGPIYRLDKDGLLQWVVGTSTLPRSRTWRGVYASPAVQYDFGESGRIAFNGDGDLLMSGGEGWGLYERTISGKLRFLGVYRGDGAPASIASEPNGNVIISYRFGLFQVHPSGAITSIRGSTAGLDASLRVKSKSPHMFIGVDGVAVAPNGTIYVDTNVGNTFTPVTAILQVNVDGNVATVWRS